MEIRRETELERKMDSKIQCTRTEIRQPGIGQAYEDFR